MGKSTDTESCPSDRSAVGRSIFFLSILLPCRSPLQIPGISNNFTTQRHSKTDELKKYPTLHPKSISVPDERVDARWRSLYVISIEFDKNSLIPKVICDTGDHWRLTTAWDWDSRTGETSWLSIVQSTLRRTCVISKSLHLDFVRSL